MTAFFSQLPKIVYELDEDHRRLVTNVLVSVRRRKSESVTDLMMFDTLQIQDGDTPEIVADKIYGHTKWWWVVLLVADVVKPSQWPKSSSQLEKSIERVHGGKQNETGTRIGESGLPVANRVRVSFAADGQVVDWHENGEGLGALTNGVIQSRGTFVSAREAMMAENEKRRSIQILSPDHLQDFVSEFQRRVAGRLTTESLTR